MEESGNKSCSEAQGDLNEDCLQDATGKAKHLYKKVFGDLGM